ncbi:hypothetical protein ACWGID_00990 [Kribbella sp. NPDC054772]
MPEIRRRVPRTSRPATAPRGNRTARRPHDATTAPRDDRTARGGADLQHSPTVAARPAVRGR